MTRYFVFLRGINVGGHHKVPMARLKEELGAQGYRDVQTVLNSGNIVLSAGEASQKELEERIAQQISKVFGFSVPVVARQQARMQQLINKEPFSGTPEDNKVKWLVTFLKTPIPEHETEKKDPALEVVYRAPDLVCSVVDLKVSGTPDAMKVLESWYGKDITTRTWQTLIKLAGK